MQFTRHNVSTSAFTVPDIRTLNAMRLVASTPSETGDLRIKLTHTLFEAIWKHQKGLYFFLSPNFVFRF